MTAGFALLASDSDVSLWVGYEVFNTVAAIRAGLAELDLYATRGVQLGTAGPGYHVRHDNFFVGFQYSFGGPTVLATRLPLGSGCAGCTGASIPASKPPAPSPSRPLWRR